jgi:hypothetical protein
VRREEGGTGEGTGEKHTQCLWWERTRSRATGRKADCRGRRRVGRAGGEGGGGEGGENDTHREVTPEAQAKLEQTGSLGELGARMGAGCCQFTPESRLSLLPGLPPSFTCSLT